MKKDGQKRQAEGPPTSPEQVCGDRIRETLEPTLVEQQERLYQLAESAGEAYWAEALDRRKGDVAERAKFALYVRRGKAGVEIHWKRMTFNRIRGKWYPRTAHVSIGGSGANKKTKYSMTKFKAAPEWERKMIADLEEIFAPLRQASKHLSKVAAAVRSYSGCKPVAAKEQTEQLPEGDDPWDLI